MTEKINEALINHCAPVLTGLKPAAIFTLDCPNCVDYLQQKLPKEFCLETLCLTNCNKILTMLYSPALFEKIVLGRQAQFILSALGYPAKINSVFMQHLKTAG
ncbi:DUF3793 family protein [Endomicrobium proavitum]|uniref:DUF3793 family protein n=1 Tax=Endomicrobium proavitum TaxID=1408281 RepID=UPI0006977A9C|nr:DUF3793 family protein [Endomicrobium proavitum]